MPRCARSACPRSSDRRSPSVGPVAGRVETEPAYRERVRAGLRASPIGQVMVERCLVGWGEIVVRGELVCPGYLDNPGADAEARRFGWHHTGDIGVFDESGYLYVVDRTKDVVISGGFNIYPSEIEQLIWSHPAVQDCAVVGVPDEDWGERLTAVIELKSDAEVTADTILDMCRNRFGSMKTPKQVEFWTTLPRSPIGKVLKKDVRARLVTAHTMAQ